MTADITMMDAKTELKVSDTKTSEDQAKGVGQVKVPVAHERRIGSRSDVGMKRANDEDSLVAVTAISAFESELRKRTLLLVADGMGGHSRGEVASRLATLSIVNVLQPLLISPDEIMEATYTGKLQQAILVANKTVYERGSAGVEFRGMGTTISIAVLDGNDLHIAQVGDSRVYLVNADDISQETKDHSFVQTLVDAGKIKPEEARTHPQKNVITRVVGYSPEVEPDIFHVRLKGDELVLVCCDGLINHVEDAEILEIVRTHSDPQAACDELIELANKRGGTDNISVVIAPVNL